MKHIMRCLLSLAALVLVSPVNAQEPQSPGQEHKDLMSLEGTWDATMKMPDGAEIKCVSDFKAICHGMWLESDFKGDFGGLPFHGRGLDGYDPAKKQYVSVWVDSMTGSPLVLTGTREGKVTTMTGEGAGPGGVTKYKTVTTNDSADKMTFRMLTVQDGKETEMMAVTYVRRK